ERVVEAEHGRRRGVGNGDVVAGDVGGLAAAGDGDQVAEQVGIRPVAEPEHRVHVRLALEGELVIDLAVEVDGQLREAEERSGAYQRGGAVGGGDAPGQLQFAVEPGVQQRSAVHLDAGLQPPLGADGRL